MDVKSLNLVLDAEGLRLKLCDFGLARRVLPQEEPLKCSGGSPRYMAPECHDAQFGPITERVDIWSGGCVMFEIFSSTLPYAECSNVQQIVHAVVVNRYPPRLPMSIEASVRGVMTCALAFEA